MITLLFISSESPAQTSVSNIKHKSVFQKIGSDFLIFIGDAGNYYTLPFHTSAKGWAFTGGAIGSSFALMAADKELKEKLGGSSNKSFNKNFWDIPTAYGFIQYPSIIASFVYASGLFTGEESARTTGRLLLESLTLSGATVIGLRYLTGRYRPYYSDDQWKYTWFQSSNDTQSFPSGHTVVAFAFSTVMAERIDNIWARFGFYGFAALTAYARILNNQHWISDVFVGGLLGFGTGWFVVNREKDREKQIRSGKKGGDKFSFYPSFNGLSIVYRF